MPKVAIIIDNEESLERGSFFDAQKDLNLVYISHKHIDNAEKLGISNIIDFKELNKMDDLDLVINTSSDPEVGRFLVENLGRHIEVLKAQGSRLICSLLDEKRKIHEEAEKSLRNQRDIYELGIKLNSSMNIQEMANAILECATKLTNTPAGSLIVYNTHNNTMRLAGITGFSQKFSRVKEWKVRKGGLTDYIMHQKEPVVIADVMQEDSFDNPVMLEEGVRSVIAVTLICEGEIKGILYVDDFTPRNFTGEETAGLALLAAEAAFGLQKAALLDELSQTKEYMEAVLKNSPDMIITTDHNTNIVRFNPGAEAMLGYKKQEVIGTSVESFYTDKSERPKLIKNVNKFGQVANYETKLCTKSGDLLDISLSLSLLKDEGGNVIGTVGISKDITRQKKLEEELKSSNTKLAKKIKEVQKIEKMKSDFLATVSHELRTPLTSIIGFSKMILRRFKKEITPLLSGSGSKTDRSAEKIKENLEIVIGEGNRLSRLINNLLDLAKIEAGKIEWDITGCSLENICKSAVNSVRSLADEKIIELRIEAEANLPDISGDKDRLIQVITNLLSNAIKFTDKGSVTCTVKNQGDWVEMRVIDTGIGLKPEDLPKVFEKFKQVGDTLTDRPKGTGLGLPICKEIVDALGGKIWVESEYGKGCSFVFILKPVDTTKTITIERSALFQEIKDKLYDKISSVEKGQKILVVDDEAHIRELLHQQLEEVGYKVIEAGNGSQALVKARNMQPDLIILDILMPEIDGFDVMTVLKNDKSTAGIPILIYSVTEDREKIYNLGADDYITKSAGQDALIKTVSSLITISRSEHKKVLIIENDEFVIKAVKDMFDTKGYEVVITDSDKESICKAQAESPDLIIIDDKISKINNNEILKILKHDKNTEDSSIIVLTGNYSKNVRISLNEK